MEIVDVGQFKSLEQPPVQPELYLVVKSLDQRERRRRLIQQKTGGKIGRIQPRPVAEGLLARATLSDAGVTVHWTQPFREPRHICPISPNRYLLSEINRVVQIDERGSVQRVYTHPWFSFLHTVQVSVNRGHMLVASSGFDMILEINLDSGEEVWRWSAWEHGFDQDSNGTRLTASREEFERLIAEGVQASLIVPSDYGEQGIVTSRRSAHPNMVVYEDTTGRFILFCVAHTGGLFRYDRSTSKVERVADFLHQMPHGLQKEKGGGWLVTDTTHGSVYLLDDGFRPSTRIDLFGLEGKDPQASDNEWIQTTTRCRGSSFLISDANRGLHYVDLQKRMRYTWRPDPDWCIQDVLLLSPSKS